MLHSLRQHIRLVGLIGAILACGEPTSPPVTYELFGLTQVDGANLPKAVAVAEPCDILISTGLFSLSPELAEFSLQFRGPLLCPRDTTAQQDWGYFYHGPYRGQNGQLTLAVPMDHMGLDTLFIQAVLRGSTALLQSVPPVPPSKGVSIDLAFERLDDSEL